MVVVMGIVCVCVWGGDMDVRVYTSMRKAEDKLYLCVSMYLGPRVRRERVYIPNEMCLSAAISSSSCATRAWLSVCYRGCIGGVINQVQSTQCNIVI